MSAEAGKIALNQFIQQEAAMNGGDETVEEDDVGLDEEITEESIVEHSGSIDVDHGQVELTMATRMIFILCYILY